MESARRKLRRTSSATGVELLHVQGFAFSKSGLYHFSPKKGDFVYGVGSTIVVYDPIKHRQTDFLTNPKSIPYSSLVFSNDGNDLFAGEYSTKEAEVKQFAVSKMGRYTLKNSFKTKFRSIDGIWVSPNKSLIAIHGTIRNSDK